MKRNLVRKSYHLDPDKVSKAKKALNAASDSEAMNMALEMAIDHGETIALARKLMKEQSEALRELVASDRQIKSDQGQSEQKASVLPMQSKRTTGEVSAEAGLIEQERSEHKDSLSGTGRRGKEKHAGKRNNQ